MKVSISTDVDFSLTSLDFGKRSVARGSSGRIWIVFRSPATGNVLAAYSDTGGLTWTTEIVVGGNNGTQVNQIILIDSNDVPHVIYQYKPGVDEIRYVSRIGGVWSAPQTVHTQVTALGLPGAAIDSSNNIHVLVYDLIAGSSSSYYRRDGATGVWGPREIAAIGSGHDLAVDSLSNVHVIYSQGNQIWLRTRTGGVWGASEQISIVAFVGLYPADTASIAIDSFNGIHVAWNQTGFAPNVGDKQVRYRRRIGGAWGPDTQVEVPTNGEDDYAPLLLLDSDDAAYVVYQERQAAADETVYWKKVINGVVGAQQTLDATISRPGGHPSLYTALWQKYNGDSVLVAGLQPVVALVDEVAPASYVLWFYADAVILDGPHGGPGGSIATVFGRYTMATRIARSAFSRMWLIENRAGPANPPSYEGLWKAGRPGWSLGDVTPIYIPSEMEYGQFSVAGKILGERGSPNLAVVARYGADALSTLLRLARLGCDHDLQVHLGDCKDPQDFNGGWDKVLVLEAARPTEYAATELGALAPGDQSTVDEEVPFSGEALYEIVPIVYAEQAEEQALQRVIDIEVCDRISCGECGIASDGCQVVFAISTIIVGSPGLPVELLYTQNGGDDWFDTTITTLAANQNPNAVACVGPNVVVISEDTESLHWAPIIDILAGPEVWTPEGTGFVGGFGPLAIFSLDPRHTWIVGEAGYIYFTDDPTIGVVVQDAGIASIQNWNAVHALDALNVVAVGNSNEVAVTRNGGETWAPLTGPSIGVALTAIWMRGPDEWFVGAADGNLYYTLDGGINWIQKEFYLDTGGAVTDIKFSSPSVGWMSHIKDDVGRIFRTIDGGYSWYVTPEGNTTIPTNLGIDALAVCENVNVIYGAGLAADDDGIIVKGEGA